MLKCYLHLGTHKTGTTSIQAYSYRNRHRLLHDGLLYPDYSPFFKQQKAISSHHRFARSVVGLDPHLEKSTAEQLVDHWSNICSESDLALFLSAENMSTLEDKQFAGNKRVGYWLGLRDMLTGFDIFPVLVLRRQDQYIESFYKERVRNIFGYRPLSFDEFSSLQMARGRMSNYSQSIESITEVFGRITLINFHDLARGNLAENFMESAFGLDSSDYEHVGNERPSLSPLATAVKVEMSALIKHQKENNLFVEWLLSPDFNALASRFLDTSTKTSLFKDSVQQRRAMDGFVVDSGLIFSKYGIRFSGTSGAAMRLPLPDLPPELIGACKLALETLREVGKAPQDT